MRTVKVIVTAIMTFGLGLCAGILITASSGTGRIKAHWKVVREYERIMKDPKSSKVYSHLGVAYIDDFPNPVPSLHALADAGELIHVDLIFPHVPAVGEPVRLWGRFCYENKGIVYAEGNHSYVDFKTQGVQPLQLKIWFKESATADVKELISLLEATSREEDANKANAGDGL